MSSEGGKLSKNHSEKFSEKFTNGEIISLRVSERIVSCMGSILFNYARFIVGNGVCQKVAIEEPIPMVKTAIIAFLYKIIQNKKARFLELLSLDKTSEKSFKRR